VGGLTSYVQKVGSKAALLKETLSVEKGAALEEKAAQAYRRWCDLSGKALPAEFQASVRSWLKSVRDALGDFVLYFHVPPAEHCVLVTSNDVREKTGKYLVRNANGNANAYGVESDGTGLFCAVADTFVTANVNKQKLEHEYSTYDGKVGNKAACCF